LAAVRLGGRWLTSQEALQHFGEALTSTTTLATEPAPSRRQAVTKAKKKLAEIGI
jgi:hypothetical protein